MTTVPQLMAVANGIAITGSHRCFYCGADADESLPASEYVKDSFNDRGVVACPGSPWVCRGCGLCLREDAELTMIDGSRRRVTKAAMRAFSWVVTGEYSRAGSKADIADWRRLCVDPPEPPFAIVLSDSGQKHLLYRGVVCWSRDEVTVTLEVERISYRTSELRNAIALCEKLIAATGKPALDEPITPRFAQAVSDYFVEWESLLHQWEGIYGQPIARLAAWVSPGRDAAREIVERTADDGLPGISPQIGGTGGPGAQDRSQRKGRGERGGDQAVFDFR